MVENSTHAFYELNAEEYFDWTYSVSLESLWAKLVKWTVPGQRILDLGCGSGRDLLYFNGLDYRPIGLDYSIRLLRLAKSHSRQPVVLADIRSLPFTGQAFDAVWAIASLLHVPDDSISSVLRRINTILGSDGVLIMSLKMGEGSGVDSLGRVIIYYTPAELQAILQENCFEVLELDEQIENRSAGPRGSDDVRWITCVARPLRCDDGSPSQQSLNTKV